ncbi:MAG: HlyD family type I secretion periplasmic adaptor subunit [Rickettsiales bacterium]|nr:HlyD family type I secretion periplasmic adaptor subunit [Rickettsiales bacterium]
MKKIKELSGKLLSVNEDIKGKNYESAIHYGIKAIIAFALLFLSWAALLPIKSASIADGLVVLDFHRKTIQHLEGGIIDQIMVKEGQMVKEGETILYLHDIQAKSERQILQERLWTIQLQKMRLQAQKNNKKHLDFSEFYESLGQISAVEEEKVKEIAANQLRLFNTNLEKMEGEVEVLQQKLRSAQTRLKIFKKEYSLIKPLVDEENLPILREFELEKSISELKFEAAIAKLQIANYQNETLSETLKEIKETDVEAITLYNQLDASRDVLKRSKITAPVAGKIMNIKYHTIGAVVPPGGDMLDIVPQNEDLIIEAKVKPQDIDNVAVGLNAKVSLTAYKGKKVPKLNGKVINVSPDIVADEKTQESYFIARIKINENEIDRLKSNVELYPGMPAQAFIITDSRSLISYLFAPIKDSAYKAFREE